MGIDAFSIFAHRQGQKYTSSKECISRAFEFAPRDGLVKTQCFRFFWEVANGPDTQREAENSALRRGHRARRVRLDKADTHKGR